MDLAPVPTPPVLYKLLAAGAKPAHGGTGRWDLPKLDPQSGAWLPGEWRSVRGPLVACVNGLHLIGRHNVLDWLSADTVALYEAEGGPKWIEADDKFVYRQARLMRPIETFTDANLRLAAADSAETSLAAWEAWRPDDRSVRETIEIVRRYAAGLASEAELSAAWSAARTAAWSALSAARSAAWSAERTAASAARSAAESAAAAAAESAARSAADSAAKSPAWSARSAAESAAWSAAWSAESAAWSAESAAWSASKSPAWSARRAAESAAMSAAESAAESAAWSPARERLADRLGLR